MKKGAVLLPLLLLIIVVACGGVSATQVERQLYDKLDKGDVAGALALTTKAAVFDIPGCPDGGCKGKDAVKGAFERVVAQHPRHTVKSSRASKNTATSQVEDELDLAKAAGVQRVVLKVNLEVKGGKIVRYQAQFDTSDPQTATAQNFTRRSGIYRHIEAINRDDMAGALATLTDDAEYVRGARCTPANPCKGKERIQRDALEFDVRFKNHYNIIEIQVLGDTATARIENRGQATRNAGVERQIQIHTVTFKGDKILRLVAQGDTTDAQTAAVANFERITRVALLLTDAVNREDILFAVAAFANDASFVGYGLCAPIPCVGTDAIRKEIQRQVGDKTKITSVLGTARVSGNAQTFRAEIRSDSIKAAGIERVIVGRTTEVPQDKITSLRWQLDTTDPQTATYFNFQRPSGLLRQHYDAVNKGDVAVTAAFFTADAVLVRGQCNPQAPCVGKAGIQLQLEREQRGQVSFSVIGIDVQVSGDKVTGRVVLRHVNIKNDGQERVIENVTATFKGDKISQLVHELDLSDPQSAAFANFRRMAGIAVRYSDALSLGNVAGAMAALAEDAVFEGYGFCAAAQCAGKAAIQKEVERQVTDKTKTIGIGGTDRVTGDTFTNRTEVRSDSIKAGGVERIIVAAMVEAKGDKVSSIRWVPDATDPQTATYLKSPGK